ncbi:helix-turn-helix domain-containing protein [Methylobacterium sp. A54F]
MSVPRESAQAAAGSVPSFAFSTQNAAPGQAFDVYHDLYAAGSDVGRVSPAFGAQVRVYRFPRMLVFDRHLSGVSHSRGAARIRRDGLDHLTIHHVVSGDYVGGTFGAEGPVRPGEILLVDAGQPNRNRVGNAHIISVSLAREQAEAAGIVPRAVSGAVLRGAGAGLAADFLGSLIRRAPDLAAPGAERAARAFSEILAMSIDPAAMPTDRHAVAEALGTLRRERAEDYIRTHLSDPALDAQAIAAGIGVSRTALYRAFEAEGGVAQLVQRRRLEAMRNALRRSEETRSVAALAHAHGFVSESHCSRTFRAAFGAPPGQFRAEILRSRAAGDAAVPILVRWTSELF